MRRSAIASTALACLALVFLSAGPAAATGPGDEVPDDKFVGITGQEGLVTSVTSTVLDRVKNGLDLKTGKPEKRSFEYTSTTACSHSQPGGRDADFMCMGAVQACAGNTPEEGQGPQVRLYRREIDAKGTATKGWQLLGTTCSPDPLPAKSAPGPGAILAAFRNTPFARPAVHIQPEGNITLVTLPTGPSQLLTVKTSHARLVAH